MWVSGYFIWNVTWQTFLTVCLQQRSFLRRNHPAVYSPLTTGFLCGPQDHWTLATRLPLFQRDSLHRSPQSGSLVILSVLSRGREPTAKATKTLTVSLLVFVALNCLLQHVVQIFSIMVPLDGVQSFLFPIKKMSVDVFILSASMDHVGCLCPAVAHCLLCLLSVP